MKQKFTLLFFLAAITYQNLSAQPLIRSQKVFGGNDIDYFTCMDRTKDGGYILGGYSSSNKSGNKTQNSRGLDDYWVVKLDSTAKIQWDKTIGGNQYDELNAIQQTSDGGYILGGYSSSSKSGEKTENSRGGYDYWVVKLNGNGNIQWDRTMGGSSSDYLYSLQQTSDGGYILGGQSESNISGEKTENGRGGFDYWVVKLNNNGNIQWNKTIGGSDYEYFNALQQIDDGGYILGGLSYSNKSGEKTENSRGGSDYWVVKLSSSGYIQWDKTMGGNSNDNLSCLQQTADGGYILGGLSYSNKSGEKTENSRGGSDYWVVKLSSSRNIQWDKTIGGSDIDELYSLRQIGDGGYILGGDSNSESSGDKHENSRGFYDYWVVKLSSSGNIKWDKTIGGNKFDADVRIKEKDKDRYVVAGTSNSGISGDKKKRSKGSSDYWLVFLDDRGDSSAIAAYPNAQSLVAPTTGNSKGFSIYPNPAKNILHIQTNGKASLSLTDQLGKILLTRTIAGNGVIDVAAIPAGLYYLKNNTTGAVQKVIVSK